MCVFRGLYTCWSAPERANSPASLSRFFQREGNVDISHFFRNKDSQSSAVPIVSDEDFSESLKNRMDQLDVHASVQPNVIVEPAKTIYSM